LDFTTNIIFWVFSSCLWYQYLNSITRKLWTISLALVRRHWYQGWDSLEHVLYDIFLFILFLP
jgi:hypothetical protein